MSILQHYKKCGFIIVAVCIYAFSSCKCTCSSTNYIFGLRKRPSIHTAQDVKNKLLNVVNDSVSNFAADIGAITTGFKKLGILGWKDIGMSARVIGKVIQTKKSTDAFYTVDIAISELYLNDDLLALDCQMYIRVEICLKKLKSKPLPVKGSKVDISGRLVWDGDGFLEIHPTRAEHVALIK